MEASVWHGSLERAESILRSHPEVARSSIHTAAILGDDAALLEFLARDPGNATARGGPRFWDALTHLCFSKYLRLDRTRSAAFVRAATALLDAGASASTGFFDRSHRPSPEWESVLYGAAGVAHHPEMTRLLVERGADPNDEEVPYHAPETHDNAALKVIVESGKLTDESLAIMLLRKADWHDLDGIGYLLGHGADPNRMTRWGYTALHQAVRRDNDIRNIAAMLDHGADPRLASRPDGQSAAAIAARRGRGDVLELLERRGFEMELSPLERWMAACARNQPDTIRSMAAREPRLVRELLGMGSMLLAQFAGVGNTDGVRHLLDLGVDPGAVFLEGDGYFGIARNSTALHVAAWRARPETVKLLIDRGAPVNAVDAEGRTPLALAVRACVDSYWTERRSPDSVRALLASGGSTDGIAFPSGYAEVDELLRAHG